MREELLQKMEKAKDASAEASQQISAEKLQFDTKLQAKEQAIKEWTAR